MAKRYYNLEKETKAFLKRMEETRGVLPDGAGIARINDYIVKRKGSGLFFGNVGPRRAVRFVSAKNQTINVVSNTSLQTGTNGFTYAFWFKNITGTTRALLSKNTTSAAANNEIEIQIGGGGILNLIVSNSTINYTAGTGSNIVLDNIFYFIVCNYDNITSTLNIYVNNVLRATTAFVGTPLQSTNTLNLGRRGNNAILLDGTLNDLGFWKRTLSTTELTYLYNNGVGRTYLELLAYNPNILTSMSSYWALNEQAGIRRDWHEANNLQSTNTPEYDIGAINNIFYLS